MIILENVFFQYKDFQVFEGASFQITENKLIGIFGKNGVGKTTLFKLILGIESNFFGDIIYDFDQTQQLKRFGALIENPPIIEYLSVLENLNYKRLLLGADKSCINEIIKYCHLTLYKHIKVKNLSLGNRQKLGIGLAILNKPKVLLLDEPTNSIDEETSKEIMEIIVEFKKQEGCSIVLISHDRNILDKYCDELYEVDNFKLKRKI